LIRACTRQQPAQTRAQTSEQDISLAFDTGHSTWATLQVYNEAEKPTWDPEEELLVRQVADQLSLALQNAQLFQETQARAEELAVLNDVGKALTGALSIEQITEITYGGISRLFDARNFYIAFYEQETNEIVFPHNVSESVVDSSITRIPLKSRLHGAHHSHKGKHFGRQRNRHLVARTWGNAHGRASHVVSGRAAPHPAIMC
jgi:hypothetical protein